MAGWPALLLLLSVTVTVAADIISCDPNEYPYANICCQRCQAGHHISRHCSRNHGVGECAPCEHNTFMAHASDKTECFPCVQCRDDQEIVAECTMTSDRRCQCKRGSFYCDSADCVENCFRCSRCPKNRVIRYPCNATADTVCGEANPESGNSHFWSSVFVPFVVVVFAIGFANLIYWKRKCLQRLFVKVFRRESVEPGSR
ncbi:tumor necrosis factor receptor superfamily member 26-like isoform X2 [Tupaia chinensis]|nr:tumor necrosis factor receptor superfamily member 26-like isoform X2 [Tupaia chinensis]